MPALAGKFIVELIPGKSYRFHHKRKGEFVAKFINLERTDAGDVEDFFVRVEIDTSEGSPYAWMANANCIIDGKKTTPPITPKLLRPSLIESAGEI